MPDKTDQTAFEEATKAIANWSVAINCHIARLRRVRDHVQEQLIGVLTHNEPMPTLNGIVDLDFAVARFEDENLRSCKRDTVTPSTKERP